ncbi:hypothetical protein TEA_019805 [Camellia sinensis var. sinensis]|uniref:Uncharacterized protein n=1 Tax=Camellia sinensis var. sinensis TaxID=542762 RepID=A0A4S4DSM4_CAMSN|nr:hypothetical protein TEA_019805 [Camellia sinensis var. sinensis]
MYAKKACELVKEFSSSEPGQLAPFNTNLFSQVIEESNFHFHQLQSLLRHNRAEVIRSLGWMIEPPLPEEIQEKLSSSEKEYSKNHSATIKSYQSEMDLDLAVGCAFKNLDNLLIEAGVSRGFAPVAHPAGYDMSQSNLCCRGNKSRSLGRPSLMFMIAKKPVVSGTIDCWLVIHGHCDLQT